MSDFREQIDRARRRFLLSTGAGLGWLALGELASVPVLAQQGSALAPNSGMPGFPHFTPKAKRVIYLHMLGAMSQVDTFDYKPTLEQRHGEELPESVRGNKRLSTMVAGQTSFPIVGPIAKFKPYGQSGTMVSDLMQNTGRIVDDIAIIRTMYTEHVNHDPASKFLHTGFQIAGRPSTGAWASYALGSENKDLPMFVVMSEGNVQGVPIDASTWSSGFIPSHYQGVLFRSGETPVTYIGNPRGLTRKDRRDMLDAIAAVANAQHDSSNDPEIPSKISQYEMSYRMQQSVPQVADISDEPDHVLDLYGPDVRRPGTFARNCLIARRLAERNVRYTMAVHLGWDAHNGIQGNHQRQCREVDEAASGLVLDLKQRGMLDDTLVVFATEFGRTSFAQGELKANYGRDHHGYNFCVWLAGGGVKGGITHGETDDFSYNIVKDGVHIHDLNATILHLLGIDHERLTYRSQGRDFRLTDVAGKVVKGILA